MAAYKRRKRESRGESVFWGGGISAEEEKQGAVGVTGVKCVRSHSNSRQVFDHSGLLIGLARCPPMHL